VAETPRELAAAEATAAGERLSDELVREIAERYAAEIEPLSDLRGSAWYRQHSRVRSARHRGGGQSGEGLTWRSARAFP
jgi:carbon-monoxide dehydrogenase medium subunit